MKPLKKPGLFPNTFVYLFGGYTYHKDKSCKRSTYRCTHSRTHCKCKPIIKKENNNYVQKPPTHNHSTPSNLEIEKSLRRRIEDRATGTHLTPTDIVNELRQDMEQAKLSPGAVKTYISRKRKANLPPIPNHFNDLKDCIKKFSKRSSIFRREIVVSDGSAIVLGNEALMEHIGDIEEIDIDWTYEYVPAEPAMEQVEKTFYKTKVL